MLYRTTKLVIFLFIFSSFFVAKTNGQQPAASKEATSASQESAALPSSPEKKSTPASEKINLVKELFDVMQAQKNSDEVSNTILSQVLSNYPQMIYQSGALKDKKDEELEKAIMESQLRFTQRFKELYPQRVKFAEILNQVYIPLYDKYFTAGELRDMIAFYKSPTGEKTIKIMPQLMRESMSQSNEILVPKVRQLINDLIEEEKNKLSKAQESTKAQEPAKTQGPKK